MGIRKKRPELYVVKKPGCLNTYWTVCMKDEADQIIDELYDAYRVIMLENKKLIAENRRLAKRAM